MQNTHTMDQHVEDKLTEDTPIEDTPIEDNIHEPNAEIEIPPVVVACGPVMPGYGLSERDTVVLCAIMDPEAFPHVKYSQRRAKSVLEKVSRGAAALDTNESRYINDPERWNSPDDPAMTLQELNAIIDIQEGRAPTCAQKVVDSAIRKSELLLEFMPEDKGRQLMRAASAENASQHIYQTHPAKYDTHKCTVNSTDYTERIERIEITECTECNKCTNCGKSIQPTNQSTVSKSTKPPQATFMERIEKSCIVM